MLALFPTIEASRNILTSNPNISEWDGYLLKYCYWLDNNILHVIKDKISK